MQKTKAEPGRKLFVTTDANLRRSFGRLITQWYDQDGFETATATGDVALRIFGLTTAVAECAETFLEINPSKHIAKGLLARSIYEFGLTAVWLSLTGDEGLQALRYELLRNNQNTASDTVAANLVGFDELVAECKAVAESKLPAKPKLAAEARWIQSMMKRLDVDNPPLYVLYRMYSQYAHGSIGVSDAFITSSDAGPRFNFVAQHDGLHRDLITALAPLAWAVNVSNDLIVGRPFTQILDTIRQQTGTDIRFMLRDS